jgi:hypothetical protein
MSPGPRARDFLQHTKQMQSSVKVEFGGEIRKIVLQQPPSFAALLRTVYERFQLRQQAVLGYIDNEDFITMTCDDELRNALESFSNLKIYAAKGQPQ